MDRDKEEVVPDPFCMLQPSVLWVPGKGRLGCWEKEEGLWTVNDSLLSPQLLMETVGSDIRSCPLCQLGFPVGYPDDALIKHIDSHLENSKI